MASSSNELLIAPAASSAVSSSDLVIHIGGDRASTSSSSKPAGASVADRPSRQRTAAPDCSDDQIPSGFDTDRCLREAYAGLVVNIQQDAKALAAQRERMPAESLAAAASAVAARRGGSEMVTPVRSNVQDLPSLDVNDVRQALEAAYAKLSMSDADDSAKSAAARAKDSATGASSGPLSNGAAAPVPPTVPRRPFVSPFEAAAAAATRDDRGGPRATACRTAQDPAASPKAEGAVLSPPRRSLLDMMPTKPSVRLDLNLKRDIKLYEDQILGTGGMGIVYRALYQGQEVAVKVIRMQHSIGEDMSVDMADFIGEINILARLDHPNVVQLYGGCVRPPQMFLVEELMVGSVADVLYKRPGVRLTLMEALKIGEDILCGLDYLHAMHVIHRDLKPLNVLLSPDGSAKISDFGLARGKYKSYLSTKHVDAGTVAYMAPECFNPDLGRISTATDIYSFGVIMCELLSNERPWENVAHAAIIFRVVLQEARPPLPSDPERCPPRLAALVRRCWAATPKSRPTATKVLLELVSVMEDLQRAAIAESRSHSVSPSAQAAQEGERAESSPL